MLIGYLLGSIPFGYAISKLYNIDIRQKGSGNIGATNVTRTLGFKIGILVFILDLLKGSLALLIAYQYTMDPIEITLVAISAIFGHMFPVFLGFKGGKGSAIGLGILLVIAPDIFIFTMLFAILVMLITRYVSMASILGAFCVVVLMFLFQKPLTYTLLSMLALILSIIKHKENIKRLINGTERKIGEKA